MATYTTNLNLKKPATSDKIRIADFNNNFDLIDSAYGDQDTSMGKLGGGMAIIATGNVHSAITVGQFVYVRKHSNLAEGLYTADSNISANGTLSTSNLSAVGNSGGLNTLSDKVKTVFGDSLISKSSNTEFILTCPTSSRGLVIFNGTGSVERFWIGYIYVNNSGGVRVHEIDKGTNATALIPDNTTNQLKFTMDSSQTAFIRVIGLYPDGDNFS